MKVLKKEKTQKGIKLYVDMRGNRIIKAVKSEVNLWNVYHGRKLFKGSIDYYDMLSHVRKLKEMYLWGRDYE